MPENITFLSDINSSETIQFNQQLQYVPFGRNSYRNPSMSMHLNFLPFNLLSIDNIERSGRSGIYLNGSTLLHNIHLVCMQ